MSKDKHRLFQDRGAEWTPRDEFAMAAMIGFLSMRTEESDERTYGFIAHAAYQQADAMMAERASREDEAEQ